MPINGLQLLFSDVLTGKKQPMTELKLVWSVNMTGHCPKIILSPEVSVQHGGQLRKC